MTDFVNEQNRKEITPTLPELLKRSVEAAMQEMRVCMPAIVQSYDHKLQKVTVQPVFKRTYADGTADEMPVIYNVPVAFPRAGESFISMPIEKGHYVLLVFSDRSMEKWLSNGGKNTTDDVRAHDLSDAIAYAGCYPFNQPASVANATDIIIKNPNNNSFSEIRIKKTGHVQILNQDGWDLVTLIDDLLTAVREARVITGDAGVQPLVNPRFAVLQAKLRTFKET